MEKLEITSMSSRGQLVIPQSIRDKLNLQTGEKFVALGEENTIILKKIEMPSFRGFNRLLRKTRQFAKTKGLNQKDVKEAIKKVRKQ